MKSEIVYRNIFILQINQYNIMYHRQNVYKFTSSIQKGTPESVHIAVSPF